MTNQEQQQRIAQSKSSGGATPALTTKIELTDQSSSSSPPAPHPGSHLHQAPNCCASCLMPIKDRFIFNVINQNFHQECVRCADCSVGLNEKCFTQDGKLYCKVDYWRRFGPKCSACSESIEPMEYVQKLKQDLIYHLSCFVCQDCKRHLEAGEQLHLLNDKKILCKRDYMNSQQQQQQQNNNGSQTVATANQATATTKQQRVKSASSNTQSTVTQQQNYHNQENHSYQQDERTRTQMAGEGNKSGGTMTSEDQLSGIGSASAQNHEDADEDEPEELDEDGASSLGADGEQFQTGGSGDNSSFPGSQTAQKAPATAIKFDPTDCSDDLVDANGKRRGPRTTIKPKQLDTLRRAFETAPKPSRHIREQLAAETGLNMRVIQVWFQNRRSKERRMRNSNGSARRNFFRSSSRRLRVGPQALATQAAPNAGAPPTPNGTSSLIAAGAKERSATGKLAKGSQQQQQQQQNSPPLDTSVAGNKSNQSPSDFGGSSTGGSGGGGGGFTYFSDSSNQGNEPSFAALASLSAGSAANQQQQQQYSQSSNSNGILQQQSPPESVGSLTPTGAGNAAAAAGLMSLESPSGAGSQHSSVAAKAAASQQQYQSSPMKNTPPPPIYQQQQQPQMIGHQQHLIPPQQHHLMQPHHMNNSHQQHHQHPQHHEHHLHHAHHRHQMGAMPGHHMVQQTANMMGPGGGIPAGLMPVHPSQAGPPSVVQW